jgi:alpha-tubulin suppressor-like RCC1 family protein
VSGVTTVAAGTAHTLALRSDGTVLAWGNNAFGQLGDGTTNSSPVAVQVQRLRRVAAISAGRGFLNDGGGVHSLAIVKAPD